MNCQQFWTIFLLISFSSFLGCKKKKLCENVSSKGRIIGYDPCRYYTPMNNRKEAGFVIEIDNGLSKDTAVTYNIPIDLFQFPYIDATAATNGQFLYSSSIQDNLKIKFNYRFALDSEKTGVLCLGIVNLGPFVSAIKGREIFLTCISNF